MPRKAWLRQDQSRFLGAGLDAMRHLVDAVRPAEVRRVEIARDSGCSEQCAKKRKARYRSSKTPRRFKGGALFFQRIGIAYCTPPLLHRLFRPRGSLSADLGPT